MLQILTEDGSLDGSDNPQLLQLVCHDVLVQAADPRAPAVLQRAHERLMQVAADIGDTTLRQGFLDAVPEHREIRRRWHASLKT